MNAPEQLKVASQVIKQGLNVRQTENLVKKTLSKNKPLKKKDQKDVNTIALEESLTNLIGLKVSIKHKGDGGALTIRYKTLEQLDEMLLRLGNSGKLKVSRDTF